MKSAHTLVWHSIISSTLLGSSCNDVSVIFIVDSGSTDYLERVSSEVLD